MLNISNVSLRAFNVAIRWAKMKGFPNNLTEWTQEQSDTLQAVAEEVDRRRNKQDAIITFKHVED